MRIRHGKDEKKTPYSYPFKIASYICIPIYDMNWNGILIGAISFLIIGCYHPLVIKGEYYFGVKIWWAFLAAGIIFSVWACLVGSIFWSAILGVAAFSSFWGILEVFHQRRRVEKGWFPKNPNRKY